MNKGQAEKNFYTFNTVFRVNVNDVKPFRNPTGRLPVDLFLDPQFMPRPLKTTNQWLNLLRLFQQFTTGVRLVTRLST